MAIMNRLIRLCKADLHGVMDQMEDRRLLLNQYLREMASALDRKENALRQMNRERERLQASSEAVEEETARLEKDITAAIRKDRDDIARFLIKKQRPLMDRQAELKRRSRELENDRTALRQMITEQKAQYEALRIKAGAYLRRTERSEWKADMPDVFSDPETGEPDEKEVDLELLRRKEELNTEETNHEHNA